MSSQAPADAANTTQAGAQGLAQSRLAILEYLQQAQATHTMGAQDTASSQADATSWRGARDTARRHWEDHPARLAIGLIAPLLSHWGRRHPLAFLGIAAAIGAALVVARPWKLISVTGVLVAALKSSNLASLAMSALAARRTASRDRGP
jgi:hypothetical protein